MALYVELTEILEKIQQDNIDEWGVGRENDRILDRSIQMPFVAYPDFVSDFEEAVYRFEENHPEFELNCYGNLLEKKGIEWEFESMDTADVSKMDGQTVMALLMGAVRAERFCDGALHKFFKRGCIQRWLERLKEIENV